MKVIEVLSYEETDFRMSLAHFMEKSGNEKAANEIYEELKSKVVVDGRNKYLEGWKLYVNEEKIND